MSGDPMFFFYIFSNIYLWCKDVPNISDFSPVEESHVNSSIYLNQKKKLEKIMLKILVVRFFVVQCRILPPVYNISVVLTK